MAENNTDIDTTIDDLKGRAKEAAGAATGNEELKDEGAADQQAAEAKGKVDEVADKVKGAVDDVKNKFS
ncbi:MAG: CsbD family protein [Actinomycetota bacterium]